MIFGQHMEMLDVQETSDHMKFTYGQDIGPTLVLNHHLREHDETKGWTRDRTMKHLASIPELTMLILMQEQPEVLRDSVALKKWLETDIGKACKVAPDATPLRGDGLQVIIR